MNFDRSNFFSLSVHDARPRTSSVRVQMDFIFYALSFLPRPPYLYVSSFVICEQQPLLAEEYEQLELENGTGTNSNTKIVYDCMEDSSPFYEKTGEAYLDPSDAIELPTDEVLL